MNENTQGATQRRWKVMDVAYGDTLRHPRRLVLEISPQHRNCYTCCSEGDGIGSACEQTLRTLDEWLRWLDWFRDDLTGREYREAREAACAPFVEPPSWTDFRRRHAETGDPWIR